MNKKLFILCGLILILAISSVTVIASGNSINNPTNTVMNLPKEIVDSKLSEITISLLTEDYNNFLSRVEELRQSGYIVYSTADEILKTKENIKETLGLTDNISVIDYQTYYCEADNSSTKDTVVVVDTKVSCGKYNILVMVEYHINKDGSIYGYNIWAV